MFYYGYDRVGAGVRIRESFDDLCVYELCVMVN